MKERPILFSGEMVRSILDGRATQTRRVIRFRHHTAKLLGQQFEHKQLKAAYPARVDGWVFWSNSFADVTEITKRQYEHGLPCPYGEPGDRLWVRETWYPMQDVELSAIDNSPIEVVYKADWDRDGTTIEEAHDVGVYWKPSIFMPRWASRLTLEIVKVRVERLQDISDDDAEAEGFMYYGETLAEPIPPDKFASYWDKLNAKRGFSWESNPWVWVIEFRMLEPAERGGD